jgi:hypothetical protein
MLNPRLPDHNRNRRSSSANIIDPVVFTKHAQALRDRFIERSRPLLQLNAPPLSGRSKTRCRCEGHTDQSSSQIERGATVFVIKKEGGTGSGP